MTLVVGFDSSRLGVGLLSLAGERCILLLQGIAGTPWEESHCKIHESRIDTFGVK
jgi:hypothetical protein